MKKLLNRFSAPIYQTIMLLWQSRNTIASTAACGSMFAFVPWNLYWPQHQGTLVDGAKIELSVSADCAKPGAVFKTDVVRSTEARTKGLGGRKTPLANNEGMLFVFEAPLQAVFWMKDTYIPLQICYFDPKGKLTSQYFMPVEATPAAPKKTYFSKGYVTTALELAPGRVPADQVGTLQLCVKVN